MLLPAFELDQDQMCFDKTCLFLIVNNILNLLKVLSKLLSFLRLSGLFWFRFRSTLVLFLWLFNYCFWSYIHMIFKKFLYDFLLIEEVIGRFLYPYSCLLRNRALWFLASWVGLLWYSFEDPRFLKDLELALVSFAIGLNCFTSNGICQLTNSCDCSTRLWSRLLDLRHAFEPPVIVLSKEFLIILFNKFFPVDKSCLEESIRSCLVCFFVWFDLRN